MLLRFYQGGLREALPHTHQQQGTVLHHGELRLLHPARARHAPQEEQLW